MQKLLHTTVLAIWLSSTSVMTTFLSNDPNSFKRAVLSSCTLDILNNVMRNRVGIEPFCGT